MKKNVGRPHSFPVQGVGKVWQISHESQRPAPFAPFAQSFSNLLK